MRELTIAESLLAEVMTLVHDRAFTRVTEIEIVVGEATRVDPTALSRALTNLCRDTPAARARILVLPEKIRAMCADCAHIFRAHGDETSCPRCGYTGIEVITGRDVMLANVVGKKGRVGVS